VKTKKTIIYALMLLSLAAGIIALPFLPEQIPAHYNAAGQVDRWGSRYETLIFPAMTVLIGLIMLAASKYSAKKEKDGQNNAKLVLTTGIACCVLFILMQGYYLYADFQGVEDLSSVSVDISRLVFGVMGVIMIVLGNLMPKAKNNAFIGLRTPWSRKNDEVWKKSQKFGGVSFMLGGLATLTVCILTEGMSCMLWSLAILVLITTVDVCYTYKLAKQSTQD